MAILTATTVGGIALAIVALERIGLARVGNALARLGPGWVALGFVLMSASMVLRAEAWRAVVQATLTPTRVRRRDTTRSTMIGVLMSALLPGRLGEPTRAVLLARRLGGERRWLATVIGTLVSQTLMNVAALGVLAVIVLATAPGLAGALTIVIAVAAAPAMVLAAVLAGPPLLRRAGRHGGRVGRLAARLAEHAGHVRGGLRVFREPRCAAYAIGGQTGAWVLQTLACWALLAAFRFRDPPGLYAAAAVLFAVNVTAVLPATPSNVGVFQAACIGALALYGVGPAAGLAYGIVLQAVEVGTALVLGVPALLAEGLSWGAQVPAHAGTMNSSDPP